MQNSKKGLFRRFVDHDFSNAFRMELPLGIRIMNFVSLLSVLPWLPLLFISIFLADAPKNADKVYPISLLILIYPFVVVPFSLVSAKIYNKNSMLAYLLSISSILLICILAYLIYDLFGVDKTTANIGLAQAGLVVRRGTLGRKKLRAAPGKILNFNRPAPSP